MPDPITRLAMLRIIKLSADLEVALATKQGGNIAIEILRRLRTNAADSLTAMAFLNVYDPSDCAKLGTLQNEVKRYDEWLGWLKEIIAEGKQYDQAISNEEREELLDVLTQSPEGQREAEELGLIEAELQDG